MKAECKIEHHHRDWNLNPIDAVKSMFWGRVKSHFRNVILSPVESIKNWDKLTTPNKLAMAVVTLFSAIFAAATILFLLKAIFFAPFVLLGAVILCLHCSEVVTVGEMWHGVRRIFSGRSEEGPEEAVEE
jgi:hypothetical protein